MSATWRSYIEAPRRAHFGTALRNRVWADPDLELIEYEEEKRLLRATTRFVVRGTMDAIENLEQAIEIAAKEWNEHGPRHEHPRPT